jgi:glutathione S-transferase
MPLTLVGQYDSPFVRRVAISLRVLGFAYQHDTRSVFADFDTMMAINPLARIPSLVLEDGTTLIDSFAILDWLDREVGPERALLPAAGAARTKAMQLVSLAAGGVEKFGAVNYEQIIRPEAHRWPDWIARCESQAMGALSALEREDWPQAERLNQAQISTGCLLGYLALSRPQALDAARFPKLAAFWRWCAARPEFIETSVASYAVPHG